MLIFWERKSCWKASDQNDFVDWFLLTLPFCQYLFILLFYRLNMFLNGALYFVVKIFYNLLFTTFMCSDFFNFFFSLLWSLNPSTFQGNCKWTVACETNHVQLASFMLAHFVGPSFLKWFWKNFQRTQAWRYSENHINFFFHLSNPFLHSHFLVTFSLCMCRLLQMSSQPCVYIHSLSYCPLLA